MPRLSLWKEHKGNDYKFFNNRAREQFTIGGTCINIHKYLGSDNTGEESAAAPHYETQSEQNIQDLLFLENRDRKYDQDIFELRGHYNVNDTDFDLSQFGLFLQNDTLFITFHLTDMIERLGRKLMSGDVVELPHLRDDFPLDEDIPVGLKKYYVVQDASRAAEGYSPTWWPHLWRIKATPLVDSREYNDIIKNISDEETDNPIGELLQTYDKYININDAIIEEAIEEVPASGYDVSEYYTTPTNKDRTVNFYDVPTADDSVVTTDSGKYTADLDFLTPEHRAQSGYLIGDTTSPPNSMPIKSGTSFPSDPLEGDYALRLDFTPNRLFRYSGTKWVKVEDNLRASYRNDSNETLLGSFRNNNGEFNTNDGQTFISRQRLSDAIKPKADN